MSFNGGAAASDRVIEITGNPRLVSTYQYQLFNANNHLSYTSNNLRLTGANGIDGYIGATYAFAMNSANLTCGTDNQLTLGTTSVRWNGLNLRGTTGVVLFYDDDATGDGFIYPNADGQLYIKASGTNGPITYDIAGTQRYFMTDAAFYSVAADTGDLGTSTNWWRDLFLKILCLIFGLQVQMTTLIIRSIKPG
jgi:hypothetical protein